MDEKEYIEMGALLTELERFPFLRTAGSIVKNTPKADVVEVKHGKWTYNEDGEKVCSICGEPALYQNFGFAFARTYHLITSDYCPHCGSKMDGEKE